MVIQDEFFPVAGRVVCLRCLRLVERISSKVRPRWFSGLDPWMAIRNQDDFSSSSCQGRDGMEIFY